MFLKASAVFAIIGLLISYLLFTVTRVVNDMIAFETYEKFRYVFRTAYYLGDFLNYFPLILFLIAFIISRKHDSKAPFSDAPTLYQ
jgi:hypothetical protein